MRFPKLRYSLSGLLLLILASAIGIAAYRKFYVPPLEQIHGLQIIGEHQRRHDVAFEQHATHQTAEHLIGQLTETTSLWFYDADYDSPSDPGAFIEIIRRDNDYLIELSNHGWSSDWFPVTRQQAVDLLWACRKSNGPDRANSLLREGMRLSREVDSPRGINRDPEYHAAKYVRSRTGR
jgi:hypothetical protein